MHQRWTSKTNQIHCDHSMIESMLSSDCSETTLDYQRCESYHRNNHRSHSIEHLNTVNSLHNKNLDKKLRETNPYVRSNSQSSLISISINYFLLILLRLTIFLLMIFSMIFIFYRIFLLIYPKPKLNMIERFWYSIMF